MAGSGSEDELSLYQLQGVGRVAERFLARNLKDLEVTPDELQVLFLLDDSPGTTAVEIAEALHWDAPFISRLVNSLAQRGLVSRRRGRTDRRIVRLRVTPQALELIADGRSAIAAADREALAQLSRTERTALQRARERLVNAYRS